MSKLNHHGWIYKKENRAQSMYGRRTEVVQLILILHVTFTYLHVAASLDKFSCVNKKILR